MSTEQIAIQYDAGATLYAAIWNSAGEVFDFADNTFKALVGATTPGLALTERADMGGAAKSGYTAGLDLSLINKTADVGQYTLAIYEQAGGSPAPDTDTVVSGLAALTVQLAESEVRPVEVKFDPAFTSTAGTTFRALAGLFHGGARVPLETYDPAATCALAVREHGAGPDLFTIGATTVNATGVFELEATNPGFTADREYKFILTVVANGVTITREEFLPVHG